MRPISTLLQVEGLTKYFHTKNGVLHAVEGVDFTLEEGRTLGVVGESGCGKSTLGRVILGLIQATSGQVVFCGEDITHASKKKRKALCTQMQLIFQDPYSSLNPRKCVSEIIAEPLKLHHVCKSRQELDREVKRLMDTVGLAERYSMSYPHELDGGRRQRIGIARALALKPKFIVCDEPVSALDVSIQAQVLNLLQDLQEELNISFLFITHDMSVVRHISDDIMVMYLGCVVEMCDYKSLFDLQLHPYTKGLLTAIPIPSIEVKREKILLSGELTSPINVGPGCRFAARCPYADEQCKTQTPILQEVMEGHKVACHKVREINHL